MAHGLPAPHHLRKLAQRDGGAPRALKIRLGDARQPRDRLRQAALRIDQTLERRDRAVRGEGDRADLDHSVALRVEASRLEVQGDVFRHGWESILRLAINGGSRLVAIGIFARPCKPVRSRPPADWKTFTSAAT